MNKNNYNPMKAVLLAMLPLLLGLTACKDEAETVSDDASAVETMQEQTITDDQLTVMVTEEMPTSVLRPFDEGTTGAALVKRLTTVADGFAPDTRLVLLPGTLFDGESDMTDDELDALVRLGLDGGFLAIERPTGQQMLNFALLYVGKLVEMQQLDYQELFDLDAVTAARAARRSPQVLRMQDCMKNIRQLAQTRGADADLNAVQAELVIYGPTDYFVQQPFEEETTVRASETDADGNLIATTAQAVQLTRTAATSGQLADAAAAWLNDVARRSARVPRRLPTRADDASTDAADTDDLLTADETFTYNGLLYFCDWQNTTQSRGDRLSIKVSAHGTYNLDSHKDYYYLTENVLLSLGSKEGSQNVYYPRAAQSWYTASGFTDYNRWFGAFLSQYETSMALTGSGTISMESSAPTFTDDSSLKLTHQADGSRVTWTYDGTLPQFYISGVYCHEFPADILVGDVSLNHEACWSVSNPSGHYSVELTSAPKLSAFVFRSNGSKTPPQKYIDRSDNQTYTYQLSEPYRAIQNWRMSIENVEYDDAAEEAGSADDLASALQTDFPDYYVPEFQVGDCDDTSLSTITTIITESKSQFALQAQHLTELAQRFGMKKFEIVWTRQGSEQVKTSQAFVYYVCPKATEATTAHLGWVYGSDGTLYPSADYARGWNATAVGILAYVNDGSDLGDLATEKASGAGHGLVLALKHTTWADIRIIHSVSGIFESTIGNSMDRAKNDFDGLSKTQALAAKGSYASQTALNYGTTPEGCTSWFIPSTGQWIAMLCQPGLGGAEIPTGTALNTHFNINGAAKLSSAARANGGSGLVSKLWTSSGLNGNTGIYLVNSSSRPRFSWYNWSDFAWVRPVFAY